VAALSAPIERILVNVAGNRATDQERVDLCNLLDEQIRLAEALHKERSRYIDAGCDKFDWFNMGTTEAERRRSHQAEAENVDRQIKNLRRVHNDHCPAFKGKSRTR
jgi:hypothetical protein